jgi:hypothetical protein
MTPHADLQALLDRFSIAWQSLDVYRKMIDLDQYLLQAGHHAFTSYRTIISVGLMRIEERA